MEEGGDNLVDLRHAVSAGNVLATFLKASEAAMTSELELSGLQRQSCRDTGKHWERDITTLEMLLKLFGTDSG